MNYFITENIVDPRATRTAGSKARVDIENILLKENFASIELNFKRKKFILTDQLGIKKVWLNNLSKLEKNSNLIIQFPLINHTIFLRRILKEAKKKNLRLILIVHDLDMFRTLSLKRKARLFLEENHIFDLVDKIVVHNNIMLDKLVDFGVQREKLESLDIFDYLIEGTNYPQNIYYGTDLIVAGALVKHKVGYLYKGPTSPKYNLYGVGYNANYKNLKYFGSFSPEKLPSNLRGSYGLIWDGDSLETCSGTYGEYLKINNPHKTSLYLASGIPVVVWKKAAIAKFVLENNLGIAVDSLENVEEILEKVSEDRYSVFKKNAKKMSVLLREGYYTKKAIYKCLE